MLKNHVGIVDHGSLVEFKLHTSEAINWWSDNVDDFSKNIRAKASNSDSVFRHVEHRYAQDIYEGMLEYFGK